MRKISRLIVCILMVAVIAVLTILPVFAESAMEITKRHGHELPAKYTPRGMIVTEVHTGRILFQENPEREWTPASMSKLMVILLAYDAINEGKFSLNTTVTVTDKYIPISKNNNLSNNVIKKGCQYTVSDLIDLIIVPSSAAATYMLSDLINPDRAALVKMMNERAASLGMTHTHYVNPVGVPNAVLGSYAPSGSSPTGDNYTCARDYAALATEIINKYPDIINHTKHKSIVVKKGTPYEEHFTGYLHALPGTKYAYPGMDGLKTGSAGKGYNYTGTAKHGDTRLVEVILGVAEWSVTDAEYKRHLIGNALLDEEFGKYEYRLVLKKGTHNLNGIEIETEEDLYDCVPKDFNQKNCVFNKEKGVVTTGVDTPFLPGFSAPEVPAKVTKRVEKKSENKTKENNKKNKDNSKKKSGAYIAGTITIAVLVICGIGFLIYKKTI